QLAARVFLVVDQSRPCPPCVGDAVANDGVKGGTCVGGTTPGGVCDAGGVTDRFEVSGQDDGKTSLDCLPTGSSGGEPMMDLNPIRTGMSTLTAGIDCLSPAFPPGACHCQGQVQANACVPDGVCGPTGVCEQNPPIGVCSGQKYRPCILD